MIDLGVDDGRVIVDSIRIPLDYISPFRALLAESQKLQGVEQVELIDDVIIVDGAYGTVKCRPEYVSHMRLLWRGFVAGVELACERVHLTNDAEREKLARHGVEYQP